MNTTTTTFGQTLWRASRVKIATFAFAAVSMTMGQAFGAAVHTAPANPNLTGPSYGQRVAEAHGCWTGAAPADMTGKFPSHVVVIRQGHDAQYLGRRMAGLALDQVFNGKDHGLEVVAFCR